MLFIIFTCLLQSVNGQYSSISDSVHDGISETSYRGYESGDSYAKPTVPAAAPRVSAIDVPSLGYRPPPPPIRRDAKSSGKCRIDHSSWRIEPQTAIANAIMFERTTGPTCEQCVEKCLHFQDPNSEWICRSLTFDHHWKICDLFAVNATSPHFLTEYADRDYLEYLHVASPYDARLSQYAIATGTGDKEIGYPTYPQVEKTAKQEPRPDSIPEYQAVHRNSVGKSNEKFCRDGDITRYAIIPNYERLNSATDMQLVKGESSKECAKECDKDETLTCLSAIQRGKECELSVSKAEHKSNDDFVFNENSTYLEKLCFPTNLAEGTEKLWPTVLDHILVGHVMEVVDASSLSECMTACLRAQQEFSFVCRSAMWYPNDEDQNCLLNAENRETYPNVFVADDQGVRMFYFEIPRISNKKEKFNDLFRDDPVDHYTRWSLCDSSNLQHRYMKCHDQRDVRKCPRQTKPCKRTSKMPWKERCIAIRDSNGRKKCPHGIRKAPSGNTEYCKNPIDCDL